MRVTEGYSYNGSYRGLQFQREFQKVTVPEGVLVGYSSRGSFKGLQLQWELQREL